MTTKDYKTFFQTTFIALYSPVMLANVWNSSFHLLDPEPVVHSKVEVISSEVAKKTGHPSTSYFPNIASPPHPQTIQEQSESNSNPPGFPSLSCFSKALLQLFSRDFFSLKMYSFIRKLFFFFGFATPYLIQVSERNQEDRDHLPKELRMVPGT